MRKCIRKLLKLASVSSVFLLYVQIKSAAEIEMMHQLEISIAV